MEVLFLISLLLFFTGIVQGVVNLANDPDTVNLDEPPPHSWFPQGIQAPQRIPEEASSFLELNLAFFQRLSKDDKSRFLVEMGNFLANTRIIGIGFMPEIAERIWIGAAAAMPVFQFPNWRSYDLHSIYLFEEAFNRRLETGKPNSKIIGLVGNGYMHRRMALCRKSLNEGFALPYDGHNTALHEFLHLIDKADGEINGLPKSLLHPSYAMAWLRLARSKMAEAKTGKSDIDEYAALSLSEFFSVVGEYFFENPEKLAENHPALHQFYGLMFSGKLKEPGNELSW